MLQKIKDWLLLILLGLISLLSIILFKREPSRLWEKRQEIKKKRNEADNLKTEYKEMIKEHDKKIKEVKEMPGSPDFDNPVDAAKYIDDIISGIRRRNPS